MTLEELNSADTDGATMALTQCCASDRWVAALVARRPFRDLAHLVSEADTVWRQLTEEDYLEAFVGHPRIGDIDSLREKYSATRDLAAGEQSSMGAADTVVLEALAQGNQRYEQRFGFMFIVCATGKSAVEMNELLQQRMHNERDKELMIAAEEQRKIFNIRLEKLL